MDASFRDRIKDNIEQNASATKVWTVAMQTLRKVKMRKSRKHESVRRIIYEQVEFPEIFLNEI